MDLSTLIPPQYKLAARLVALAVIAIAIAAAVAAVNHWDNQRLARERSAGRAEIQQKWDQATARQREQDVKDEAAAAAQYQADAEAHARESFRRTEVQAEAERKKDAEIAALTRRADALDRELRARPSRPAAAGGAQVGAAGTGTADPAVPASCTGTGLYREDGQFLAREAAAAARIAAERDECHDKYDALTAPH